MHLATKAVRASQNPDPVTGSIIMPIHPSVNFQFQQLAQPGEFEYSRASHPTRSVLEKCLAELENAQHGLAFSSGMSAIDCVLSILRPGDQILSCPEIYGGTHRLFEQFYRPRGIDIAYAQSGQTEHFAKKITPQTRLIWLESPSNPLLKILDIQAICEVAQAANIPVAVDNTFLTPCFQNPLALGATVVVHSTTKYLSGHSDVLGGAILTNDTLLHEQFHLYQKSVGAVPGPFEAWLTLRGIKTLSIRMRQHQHNALEIAHFLKQHPSISEVIYPGLPEHPHHSIALRQMQGFGGMVSIELKKGYAGVAELIPKLQLFLFAESLGGVESLISHPATMSHGALTPSQLETLGIRPGHLRLSVGIEDSRDLIAELDRVL
jgi:cystathionine beta-lyase/cystathionine gamma-synthase